MKRIQIENRTDLASEIPLQTPYCLFIDPSSACNFKCKFCMNQKIEQPKIMSLDLFKKIIDDLEEFSNPVKTVRLYGFGEPLLNTSFCEMVRYAKASKKVLRVDTTTNASLLNEELTTKLIDSGIDRINISIESMSTSKYRDFTQNRYVTFEKIVEEISRLYKMKTNTTIFVKINGDYLDEDEKQQFLNTFSSISDGCDLEHTMNCWRDFEGVEANQNVGIYGQPLKEVIVCPYVFYSFFVHADGEVSSCFLDWNRKLIIGSAKDESIKSLWQSASFSQFRRLMISKERKRHAVCRDCQQLVAGMPVDLDAHAEEILRRMNANI